MRAGSSAECPSRIVATFTAGELDRPGGLRASPRLPMRNRPRNGNAGETRLRKATGLKGVIAPHGGWATEWEAHVAPTGAEACPRGDGEPAARRRRHEPRRRRCRRPRVRL